jgi:hypothetical protein
MISESMPCRKMFADLTVAKGLVVVDVGLLSETTMDPVSLVALQEDVSLKFVHEDPFASYDIGSKQMKNQVTGVVGD